MASAAVAEWTATLAAAVAAAVPAPAVAEPYSKLGECDLNHTFGEIKRVKKPKCRM